MTKSRSVILFQGRAARFFDAGYEKSGARHGECILEYMANGVDNGIIS